MFWSEYFSCDNSSPFDMFIAPGNLWSKCQEKFIQALF